jgi:hypothetical protein
VIGDGSIILYLLYAAQTFQVDEFRQLASNGGDRLLAVASKPHGGGLKWKGASSEALGLPADTYFPNFELGAAGEA